MDPWTSGDLGCVGLIPGDCSYPPRWMCAKASAHIVVPGFLARAIVEADSYGQGDVDGQSFSTRGKIGERGPHLTTHWAAQPDERHRRDHGRSSDRANPSGGRVPHSGRGRQRRRSGARRGRKRRQRSTPPLTKRRLPAQRRTARRCLHPDPNTRRPRPTPTTTPISQRKHSSRSATVSETTPCQPHLANHDH